MRGEERGASGRQVRLSVAFAVDVVPRDAEVRDRHLESVDHRVDAARVNLEPVGVDPGVDVDAWFVSQEGGHVPADDRVVGRRGGRGANAFCCPLTGTRMSRAGVSGTRLVGSRWWYVPAFVVAWLVLGIFLLAGYLLGVRWLGAFIVVIAYIAVATSLFHPFAIYFDATTIAESGGEWQPNTTLYVAGAVLGIVVPFLQVIVAVVYLHRRHRYVGSHRDVV